MNKLLIAAVVAGCATLAGAQNTGQTNPPATPPSQPQPKPQAQNQGQPAHPRRVVAKLDGFDLAPAKASANQIGGGSRGAGADLKLVLYAPHKAKIYTLRPAFAWKGDPSAKYKLHIQDVMGTFAWDRELTGTSLAYPGDAPPLSPGGTYLWKVDPVSPLLGPPPPAAMIVVLNGAERAQVESGLGQFQGTDFDAESGRAKYFFDQRLWYDAVMGYTELIQKYPERENLYVLRGTLYFQLPATESLADADFAHTN
jgi:hypothetical protein